jgi:hypothetical protein
MLKNANDTIGNQTRNLPAYSEVPQPTASPCASLDGSIAANMSFFFKW